MGGDHAAQMEDCFNQLPNLFPEPVVFVHYWTEQKLLQELSGRYKESAPRHSYCDLFGLARAIIDRKNTASDRLYFTTRNLATILKYWWKGEEVEITRVLELLISTGRKSEMDVSIISIQASKLICFNKYLHSHASHPTSCLTSQSVFSL